MKKEHRNKMIAPIIIAAVLIVYYVAIAAVFMLIPDLTVIMIIDGNYSAGTGRSSICSNRRTCAGDKEWRRR